MAVTFRGIFHAFLFQVAKDCPVAWRWPRIQQWAFHLDPLDHQAGTRVFVCSYFFHRRRERWQAVGDDANAVLGLQLFRELNDLWLVCGKGVIIDETLLGHLFQRARSDVKVHRLSTALITVA